MFGSSSAAPSRTLRFEQLGSEHGLPQESILTVLQDSQGFMWLGTQAGLCSYDGYRVTVYKNEAADPQSIADSYVLSSFEDKQGRLWFGTKGGLNRYDPVTEKFTRYLPTGSGSAANADRAVLSIISDGDNGLWLATGDGLKRFYPESGKFVSVRHDQSNLDSIGDDRVSALAVDAEGNLWVGTASGLERMARGTAKFEHFRIDDAAAAEARQNSVLSLSVGPENTLWIGTEAGLNAWRIAGGELLKKRFGQDEGVGQGRMLSLLHDRSGALWAGTDGDGLKRFDAATGRFISYRHELQDRHSLGDNRVSALYQDRTGTLWIGTWYSGANRIDLSSGGFEQFRKTPGDQQGLSENKILAIEGDGGKGLWLGSLGGGLNHLDPASGKVEVLRHDPGDPASLHDNQIMAVGAGSLGRLWVGTQTGLTSLDPKTRRFTRVALGDDPGSNYIERIFTDRKGVLWIASRGGGVHRIEPGLDLVKTYRHDPADPSSLADNWALAILEDRHGDLWIGTSNGLDKLDRATGRFTHFRHDEKNLASLSHNRIHYLYEDGKSRLWVGTAGGLNQVERGAGRQIGFTFHALGDGRVADPIGGILEDREGRLWISTTAGISRFDPVTKQFKNYTSKDGLIDGSFFIGSAYKSPDGTMNFGGFNGVSVFKPDAIHDNPHAPAIHITDFQIFNQSVRGRKSPDGFVLDRPIKYEKALTLSYLDSVFSLEFSGLHYADPQRNRYAYKLEGFDQKWIDTSASKRFVTYTNLDPGRYVFHVKASNKDGVWDQLGAALEITIKPPFWETWWFRIITISLFLGSAFAVYRARIGALVQQKNQLELQVRLRTAELVFQKESVEKQKQEVERQKETVELAHRNISTLSEIGRQITAELKSETIMMMLYENVNALMDASVFGIGFYRPEREIIEYPFAIERGKRYLPYTRSMGDKNQLAVWCLLNSKEVFINNLSLDFSNYIENLKLTCGIENIGALDDGSQPDEPVSMLYVPISVSGRMMGVISVHSFRPNAYQRIDLDMLRTLASYVGVALDNASAYRQLKDAQQQLVEQEKMAALGSLVAGVAHELNTPIGNSLMIASTIQERTEDIARKIEDSSVRRSDLNAYIADTRQASELMMRGLNNAADLVSSFKQVAVDQASVQRRRFNLHQAMYEIVATMMNQIRKTGNNMLLDMPGDIEMDSYPGPLGQVIINFINNALLHAFDDHGGGHIRLSAKVLPMEKVQIQFNDDGAGIPEKNISRIFDPFFTTKLGQGGSGLGLNITYNIVTSLLGGQIRVESIPGKGTTFIIDLPLSAM